MNWLWSLSLTGAAAQAVIVASWACGVVLAAWGKYRLRAAGAAGAITVAIWWVLEVAWRPFPDRVDWRVYLVGMGVIFSLICLMQRRAVVIISVVLTTFATLGTLNLVFQEYPTVRSFDPTPVAVDMPYAQFQASSQPPRLDGREVGALVTVDLPGSGFQPRSAVAYVPPAYWRGAKLPVMVLMAGNPGSPDQWFHNGEAAQTADAYQERHGGVAPIVVSVDATGSFTGNPLCTDGPEQKVMTYLTQDVPAGIHRLFRAEEDQSRWIIGGLSYGGTCALQVVTNHPEAYGTFLNFSGQAEPTMGDHGQTVERFFGGEESAFAAQNPADLLASRAYPHTRGRFVAGERDAESVAALTHLNDLARASGMDTRMLTVPGGHSFEVWRVALAETFDWAVR
ncbi:alpha/beta hydrolase [Corynebacterium oculi]|uniref:Putative esterase n=1 Tax=Corynebacterium oculi TaxID=1544416 RepID=A0A0Q0Z3D3_9CORY|nr:alpha/beta hydrolase-fold protein [Corynebacterium oculi]KQB83808.1 putative esterase [Corynebacterium oculi]